MNVPPACYSCGNRIPKVKTECCKMRKLLAGVSPKFQGWRDELALPYHGVQSVLDLLVMKMAGSRVKKCH